MNSKVLGLRFVVVVINTLKSFKFEKSIYNNIME